MDKKQMQPLVNNPRFIPGIYNYCDRWCERCAFTLRCSNYALIEEQFSDTGDRDVRNERFWDKLGEVFRVTLEMLHDEAERRGLKLDAVGMAAADESETEIEGFASNHECTRSASAYSERVEQWFEQRLRMRTEEHFPAARSFVRPGFDKTVEPAQTSDDLALDDGIPTDRGRAAGRANPDSNGS